LFEECKVSLTVENRNRYPPAIPADEMLFDQLIGDAPAI
jgi:hypothetical protein